MAALFAIAVALVAGCSSEPNDEDAGLAPGGRMPGGMTMVSTAFEAGDAVPERFSCEGENVPPPLRWDGIPPGTGELALVIEDPDAPDGIFVHWLVVGIDPATREVGPSGPPPGARVLPGSSDNPTYIGPCPPDGAGNHRYFFQIYALQAAPHLPDTATPLERVRAIRTAATASGVLMATFQR